MIHLNNQNGSLNFPYLHYHGTIHKSQLFLQDKESRANESTKLTKASASNIEDEGVHNMYVKYNMINMVNQFGVNQINAIQTEQYEDNQMITNSQEGIYNQYNLFVQNLQTINECESPQSSLINDSEEYIVGVSENSGAMLNHDEDEKSKCNITFNEQNCLLLPLNVKPEDIQLNKCSICKNDFSESTELQNYNQTHNICATCYSTFNSCNDLKLHIENKSLIYNKYSEEPQMITHIEAHDRSHNCLKLDKIHECSICKQKFNQDSDWELHLNWHNDIDSISETIPNDQIATFDQKLLLESNKNVIKDKRTFKCETCSIHFSKKSLLIRHEKCHEKIRTNECHDCSTIFNTKSDLTFHLRNDFFNKIKNGATCNQEFKYNSLLIRPIKTKYVKENSFMCCMCSNIFYCSESLINHLMTHQVNELFSCALCPAKYTLSSNLLCHLKTHHFNEKLFQNEVCNRCFQVFKKKSHFKFHKCFIPYIMYECHVCNIKFDQKSDLILHMKRHFFIKEQTEKCSTCCQEFRNKSILEKHIKMKHSQVNSFTCNMCNSIFYCKSSLINHIMVAHTITNKILTCFLCVICNGEFKTKSILERHLKMKHTKMNLFTCCECDKMFSHRSSLFDHLLSHDLSNTMDFVTSSHSKNNFKTSKENKYFCCMCKKEIILDYSSKNIGNHKSETIMCSTCKVIF